MGRERVSTLFPLTGCRTAAWNAQKQTGFAMSRHGLLHVEQVEICGAQSFRATQANMSHLTDVLRRLAVSCADKDAVTSARQIVRLLGHTADF